jgi:hypothetical protein
MQALSHHVSTQLTAGRHLEHESELQEGRLAIAKEK